MTQDEYIPILFDRCGFTGSQRRDFLASRFNGRKYADELSIAEKSRLIEDLQSRSGSPATDDDGDPDADRTAKERAKRWPR